MRSFSLQRLCQKFTRNFKRSHFNFNLDEDDIYIESRSPAACLHDVCQGGGAPADAEVSKHREDAVQSDPRQDVGRAASS